MQALNYLPIIIQTYSYKLQLVMATPQLPNCAFSKILVTKGIAEASERKLPTNPSHHFSWIKHHVSRIAAFLLADRILRARTSTPALTTPHRWPCRLALTQKVARKRRRQWQITHRTAAKLPAAGVARTPSGISVDAVGAARVAPALAFSLLWVSVPQPLMRYSTPV